MRGKKTCTPGGVPGASGGPAPLRGWRLSFHRTFSRGSAHFRSALTPPGYRAANASGVERKEKALHHFPCFYVRPRNESSLLLILTSSRLQLPDHHLPEAPPAVHNTRGAVGAKGKAIRANFTFGRRTARDSAGGIDSGVGTVPFPPPSPGSAARSSESSPSPPALGAPHPLAPAGAGPSEKRRLPGWAVGANHVVQPTTAPARSCSPGQWASRAILPPSHS